MYMFYYHKYPVMPHSAQYISSAFAVFVAFRNHLHLCFSQILASNNFWQVANNLGSKDKSPLVHLFDGFELVSFVFDLVTLFAEIFSAKSNHDDSLPD